MKLWGRLYLLRSSWNHPQPRVGESPEGEIRTLETVKCSVWRRHGAIQTANLTSFFMFRSPANHSQWDVVSQGGDWKASWGVWGLAGYLGPTTACVGARYGCRSMAEASAEKPGWRVRRVCFSPKHYYSLHLRRRRAGVGADVGEEMLSHNMTFLCVWKAQHLP